MFSFPLLPMPLLYLLVATASLNSAHAEAKGPNIIFITSEDNDWHWLGCYGNKQAKTPNLDALSRRSVLFTHAYSNAPVCAVARSTILNGMYAVSQGTQHMRSRHPIPDFKPYTHYLRQLGYYCTNRAKTDYNFEGNDKSLWDECSGKAHYRNRPQGSPFFAVFNSTTTHESALFEEKIRDRRKKGIIPRSPRIDPSDISLRPYLPDLPEIRTDVAIYHDTMTAYDREVGKILAQLKEDGLAEDTIIFYYSDHGGITPRGKRYLKDSGVRVPMIVHVPEKWKHLSDWAPGQRVNETVSFVDLAPTLLSVVGAKAPANMQGRAFLGKHRRSPGKDDVVFLFADRFDEFYGMRRGLTDGRWKYIRRFTSHLAAAPYSNYQFRQAGWRAWRQKWQDGKLQGRQKGIWEMGQAVEELYDTQSDPWEVSNLASDPGQRGRLEGFRGRLMAEMVRTRDCGIIPEPMFHELAPDRPVADYYAARKPDHLRLVKLAFMATERNPKHLPVLSKLLQSEDPLTRYWAVQGCLILGEASQAAGQAVEALLQDNHSAIRVAAAQTLAAWGLQERAVTALLREVDPEANQYVQQNTIHALTLLGAESRVPDSWIKAILNNENAGKYVKWFAESLAQKRK